MNAAVALRYYHTKRDIVIESALVSIYRMFNTKKKETFFPVNMSPIGAWEKIQIKTLMDEIQALTICIFPNDHEEELNHSPKFIHKIYQDFLQLKSKRLINKCKIVSRVKNDDDFSIDIECIYKEETRITTSINFKF
jgi:hypothetical protein